ncbi:putative tail fiber protein [Paracoccus phage vB_PmaP_KLEP18-1]|nr:putative tail fiber protein [Paracoccus phage vB_PmaP_KLEP18-1]
MSVFDYSTTPGANTSVDGVNIAEGMPPGNVNNAMRSMMADTRKMQLDMSGAPTTGGTGDNYTLTVNQNFTGYSAGMRFTFRFNRANTTNGATLNVNGQGQRSILTYRGGAPTAIPANAIVQNGVADVVYSPADNGFVMLSIFRVRISDVTMPGPALAGRISDDEGFATRILLGDGVEFSGTSLRAKIGAGLEYVSGGIAAVVRRFSTLAEAQGGTNDNTAMTPLRTRQATGLNIATLNAGQIGTYALLGRDTNATQINPGEVVNGSTLRYAGIAGFGTSLDRVRITLGNSPAGRWQAMGVLPVTEGGGGDPARAVFTQFLRVE